MELEVVPYRNPICCALCWWEVRVAHLHNQLNNAIVRLDGVPLCEGHLQELLTDIFLRKVARFLRSGL